MTAYALLRNTTRQPIVGPTGAFYAYASVNSSRYSNGYEHRKAALIPRSAIRSTLTNVPVRIVVTDARLKTVANGGRKYNDYDHIFTTSGGTEIPYLVENYDATTGKLIAWLKVPTLSPNTSNLIYLYYRNTDVNTTRANAASVASDYLLWLLPPSETDQSSGARNANSAFSSITVGDLSVGSFDGTDTTRRYTTANWLNGKTSLSISVSFSTASASGQNILISKSTTVNSDPAQLIIQRTSANNLQVQMRGATATGSAVFDCGTQVWTALEHIHVVLNAGELKAYLRGKALTATSPVNVGGGLAMLQDVLHIGGFTTGGYVNGKIGCIRVCNTVISADRALFEDKNIRFTDSVRFADEESPGDASKPIVERIFLPLATTSAFNIDMTNYTYAPTGVGSILSYTTPSSGTLTKPNSTTLTYTPAATLPTTEVSFDVTMRFP